MQKPACACVSSVVETRARALAWIGSSRFDSGRTRKLRGSSNLLVIQEMSNTAALRFTKTNDFARSVEPPPTSEHLGAHSLRKRDALHRSFTGLRFFQTLAPDAPGSFGLPPPVGSGIFDSMSPSQAGGRCLSDSALRNGSPSTRPARKHLKNEALYLRGFKSEAYYLLGQISAP
jgi:hypothetical protein